MHRDLKPGNIMFGPDGEVALMDFGLARPVSVTGAGATVTNTLANLAGTLPYLSPEQFQDETPGPASDRYALGVTACELLTRRYPFEATNPVALGLKVVANAPPPVRGLRPDVPEHVERAVARMLAKAPGDRFGTSVAFVHELGGGSQRVAQGTPAIPVARVVILPPAPVDPRKWTVVAGKAGGGAGARGTGAGEFRSPRGIAVDGNGAVWVADFGNNRIQVRDPDGKWWVAGGKPGRGSGAEGSGAGEFRSPRGIAVDGNGAVWVAEWGNSRIQVRDLDGTWRIVGGKYQPVNSDEI